mmetsp:Transcript_30618/g.62919  ORF Transcript_30618/g.62919 Transcript_30618/m.62919 type:complete len:93 (-) Transcript_30618:181-459(-)
MGSQESLARSLSAIHKGNSKRHGSLHFLDIPSLPFGSEESNATASDANNPSGLQRRSTYSHSQPPNTVAGRSFCLRTNHLVPTFSARIILST